MVVDKSEVESLPKNFEVEHDKKEKSDSSDSSEDEEKKKSKLPFGIKPFWKGKKSGKSADSETESDVEKLEEQHEPQIAVCPPRIADEQPLPGKADDFKPAAKDSSHSSSDSSDEEKRKTPGIISTLSGSIKSALKDRKRSQTSSS